MDLGFCRVALCTFFFLLLMMLHGCNVLIVCIVNLVIGISNLKKSYNSVKWGTVLHSQLGFFIFSFSNFAWNRLYFVFFFITHSAPSILACDFKVTFFALMTSCAMTACGWILAWLFYVTIFLAIETLSHGTPAGKLLAVFDFIIFH